ncbi:OmpH family outer membrane protein [Geobacter sp. DSM 9736]|uniref:OmpH family outer membrane protein n=1 Tax=Geobacter sp. DSM 9736 TaxID=1277350 RepID=UPI000B5131D9|nr:OmpH family outer membrane protein [Geobacter sp. DSM 9736]SNB45010.1 periplasmic chaperone for outer membrane proteins Skp [Geobacter sp. DSM 9736]
MKRAITASVLLLCLAFAAPVLAEGGKIGSVDVQKVLLFSESGKGAKEQLAQKANKYELDKNTKEEELKKLKAELEKQSVLLSESARITKEKDYQQKLKEYQRFLKDAQDDLQAKNDELTSRIVDEIVKVVQDYGRKNKYTFIFVKNEGMIYQDETADVTDDILKQFNASKKK